MDIHNNNHSVFTLKYKLLLMTVKPVSKIISDRLMEIFKRISASYNITLCDWGHDRDKIKIIFYAHPNSELSKFINAYKSASSRLIKKEFSSTLNNNNKQFWTKTFGLFTIDSGIDDYDIFTKIKEKRNN